MALLRRLPIAALLLGSLALLPGCFGDYETEPVVVTSADYAPVAYAPAYYDGYVVYYDDGGRPYYYDRGAVVWVAPSSPHYVGLVHHYHYYRPAYVAWNAHYGYRYRTYRAAPHYHVYHGSRGHRR